MALGSIAPLPASTLSSDNNACLRAYSGTSCPAPAPINEAIPACGPNLAPTIPAPIGAAIAPKLPPKTSLA